MSKHNGVGLGVAVLWVGAVACTQSGGSATNDTDTAETGDAASRGADEGGGDDDGDGGSDDGADESGVPDIPVAPPPREIIVAAASGGVVDVSCDDGLTWQSDAWVGDPAYDGDGDHGQYALHGLAHGNGAFYLAFGWGAPTGLYFRSDDGQTWTQVAPDASVPDDEVPTAFTIAVDGDHVTVAGGRDVIVSEDAGQSWGDPVRLPDVTGIDPSATIKHPKLAHGNGTHVIVANDWIFYSQDGASTWAIADLPVGGCGTQAVDFGGGVFVTAGSDIQPCWSADGETWTAASVPANPTSVGRRGVNWTGDRFVLNEQWGNDGLESADGQTWVASGGGPGGQLVRTEQGTLLAVASGGGQGAIQRSTDGGVTWTTVHDRSQDAAPVKFRRIAAGTVASSPLCPDDG